MEPIGRVGKATGSGRSLPSGRPKAGPGGPVRCEAPRTHQRPRPGGHGAKTAFAHPSSPADLQKSLIFAIATRKRTERILIHRSPATSSPGSAPTVPLALPYRTHFRPEVRRGSRPHCSPAGGSSHGAAALSRQPGRIVDRASHHRRCGDDAPRRPQAISRVLAA